MRLRDLFVSQPPAPAKIPSATTLPHASALAEPLEILPEIPDRFERADAKPLLKAIDDGDLPKAEELLDSGVDPNAHHPILRQTLLHRALDKKQFDIAKLLLNAGSNPNTASPVLVPGQQTEPANKPPNAPASHLMQDHPLAVALHKKAGLPLIETLIDAGAKTSNQELSAKLHRLFLEKFKPDILAQAQKEVVDDPDNEAKLHLLALAQAEAIPEVNAEESEQLLGLAQKAFIEKLDVKNTKLLMDLGIRHNALSFYFADVLIKAKNTGLPPSERPEENKDQRLERLKQNRDALALMRLFTEYGVDHNYMGINYALMYHRGELQSQKGTNSAKTTPGHK